MSNIAPSRQRAESTGLVTKNGKIRKYPKTTGITVTGECGHSYVTRLNTPYALIGQPRSPKAEKKLAAAIADTTTYLAKLRCPECGALDDLVEVQDRLRIYSELSSLSELKPMEGTPRMRAFAEELRFEMLDDSITAIQLAILSEAETPYMFLALAADGIRALYPSDQTEYPEDFKAVAEKLGAHQPFYRGRQRMENSKTPLAANKGDGYIVSGLAEWLLVRYKFNFIPENALEITDSTRWVKNRKGRGTSANGIYGPYFSQKLPLNIVYTALLTASNPGWKTLEEMEAAFKTLLKRMDRSSHNIFSEHVGSPLPETVEIVQVMRALQDQEEDWNYNGLPPF